MCNDKMGHDGTPRPDCVITPIAYPGPSSRYTYSTNTLRGLGRDGEGGRGNDAPVSFAAQIGYMAIQTPDRHAQD